MPLLNEVLNWRYVNVMYMAAMQMRVNINQKMLLIFEMEGVFFSSYARDGTSFEFQRKPDWEFDDRSYFFRPFHLEVLKYCLEHYDVALWTLNVTDKYIRQVLEKSNIDPGDFEFIWDWPRCRLQTKFKSNNMIQFYEKRLSDV